MTWPAPPPPLKLRPYGGIEMNVLLLLLLLMTWCWCVVLDEVAVLLTYCRVTRWYGTLRSLMKRLTFTTWTATSRLTPSAAWAGCPREVLTSTPVKLHGNRTFEFLSGQFFVVFFITSKPKCFSASTFFVKQLRQLICVHTHTHSCTCKQYVIKTLFYRHFLLVSCPGHLPQQFLKVSVDIFVEMWLNL